MTNYPKKYFFPVLHLGCWGDKNKKLTQKAGVRMVQWSNASVTLSGTEVTQVQASGSHSSILFLLRTTVLQYECKTGAYRLLQKICQMRNRLMIVGMHSKAKKGYRRALSTKRETWTGVISKIIKWLKANAE